MYIAWRDIAGRIIAVFFPERCVLCDEVVAYEDMCCVNCGYHIYGDIDCGHMEHKFAGAVAGAEYEGKLRQALLRIKTKPHNRTLQFFAELMEKSIRSCWGDVQIDLIVPVPINRQRLEKRGFNQAEELARRLSRLISVPVEPNVLIRHDDSRIQHTLKKDERRANAAKAYDLAEAGRIERKSLLLVDDVFTTGATVSACTDKLMAAGASKVYVATATAVRLQKDQRDG